MASTINATTGLLGGIVSTGDTSGQLELQADGTTKLTVSSSGVTIPTLVGANVNLASNVTGTLPIANGGTGTTSTTFANLTTNVTGTLPVANGGTGATTLTGYVKGAGTSALSASSTIPGSDISGNISGNAANVTGTVAVANGGTGATSLTANNVLLGNGTSALQTVAPGSSGNVLTSNGTTWQSTAPAGSSPWVYLGQVNATGSTNADITGFFDSTYHLYVITLGMVCTDNTNQQQFYCRFFLNGSLYSGSSYNYNNSSWIANANQFFSGQSQINFSGQSFNRADQSYFLSGMVYVPSPTVNGFKQIYGVISGINNPVSNTFSASEYSSGGQLTGLRFYFQSGNFGSNISTQSIFRVYGIKNS